VKYLASIFIGLAWPLATAVPALAEERVGPLAEYVRAPDASFGWVKRREGRLGGNSYVELTLTSQTWRGIVWKHQLFIIKPDRVRDASRALLLIGGGSWRDELAEPITDGEAELPREAALLSSLAAEIAGPVAVLLHVPQQPIFGGMYEDDIISHTFVEYMKTRDPTWPLLLPMVKSAVRGMDAVADFALDEWSLEIKNFTLTGASKRGWTTWLAAAVDPRVDALAPMVIDVLNMAPQMQHQLDTWGKFSEQIEDYTKRGIQARTATEEGALLRGIVDPYSYRRVLVQPKLILLGTNDRYWPLDALNLYWDGLPGEKHVLYVPNNGHGLRDFARVVGSIAALHRQAAGELKLPRLSWDLAAGEAGLRLELRSDRRPARVQAWTASSASKDFREARWESVTLQANSDTYRYELPRPAEDYVAMFGEAMFETDGLPYFLSTNVKILAPASK
jgi:PhoPQ-activated pathogenicity-related protein